MAVRKTKKAQLLKGGSKKNGQMKRVMFVALLKTREQKNAGLVKE